MKVAVRSLNIPTDNNPEYSATIRTPGSGTYQQLSSFIHAIETGPRLANITYFALRRRPQHWLDYARDKFGAAPEKNSHPLRASDPCTAKKGPGFIFR